MKLKTLGRVGGAVDFGTGCFVGYASYVLLPHIGDIGRYFFGLYPTEQNMVAGASLMTFEAAMPLFAGLVITDGAVDMVKGTHHYFGCRLWQKLTRNTQTKERIDRELHDMLTRIEYPLRLSD